MDDDSVSQSEQALIASIDVELAVLQAAKVEAVAAITALDAEQALLPHHPNYTAYRHGGVAAVRSMGAQHILAHAGFFLLPYGDAIDRLANARAANDGCLIRALRTVCESAPPLEIAGLAWLGEHGLLKHGALDPFWLKRSLLGLGQPARLHGLEPHHAPAHRGLYALDVRDLRARFGAVEGRIDASFGDLLLAVIEAGGATLTALGTAASERDAAERYWATCASFAAHQRRTDDRRWRWKPPLSRQGHLAVTTAKARGVAMPAERTRGHAATWLDDNGANPRFRKD